MSNIFPGMNPYLEHPEFWSEIHSRLMVNLADDLAEKLRPKYFVTVEKRTYINSAKSTLIGIPDVSILKRKTPVSSHSSATATLTIPEAIKVTIPMPEEVEEIYLTIKEVNTEEFITVIELLSPKNKRSGEGRKTYLEKRMKVLGSFSNLVEIDLLRSGNSMPILTENSPIKKDYQILISCKKDRPLAELYPFTIRDTIPCFYLPLESGDMEPLVNLGELLNIIYEKASFDLRIDYSKNPVPPLKGDDNLWLDELLKQNNLR